MGIPWAIVISVIVVLAAFLLKGMFLEALEEDEWFKYTVLGFLVFYVVAAIGVYYFSPPIQDGQVSLESLTQPLSLNGDNNGQ